MALNSYMPIVFKHKFGSCNWYTDAYSSRICRFLSWWPKSLLAKAVTGAQIGVIGLIMGCEHIFLMIGIAHLPAWSCEEK
ncbi:unnamed protein product [Brassica oleracea]